MTVTTSRPVTDLRTGEQRALIAGTQRQRGESARCCAVSPHQSARRVGSIVGLPQPDAERAVSPVSRRHNPDSRQSDSRSRTPRRWRGWRVIRDHPELDGSRRRGSTTTSRIQSRTSRSGRSEQTSPSSGRTRKDTHPGNPDRCEYRFGPVWRVAPPTSTIKRG